jgi:hypothetical protein
VFFNPSYAWLIGLSFEEETLPANLIRFRNHVPQELVILYCILGAVDLLCQANKLAALGSPFAHRTPRLAMDELYPDLE